MQQRNHGRIETLARHMGGIYPNKPWSCRQLQTKSPTCKWCVSWGETGNHGGNCTCCEKEGCRICTAYRSETSEREWSKARHNCLIRSCPKEVLQIFPLLIEVMIPFTCYLFWQVLTGSDSLLPINLQSPSSFLSSPNTLHAAHVSIIAPSTTISPLLCALHKIAHRR